MTDQPAPVAPAPIARVWSPLAVAMYGLLLAYPAALLLAVKNWVALGQRDRIMPHVVGGALLSLPLFAIMIFSSPRTGRVFGLVANVMAFVYLKEKLKSDLSEFQDGNADVPVETRRWYTALGWALLGIAIFVALYAAIAVRIEILHALMQPE
jgi:hypothetical protein